MKTTLDNITVNSPEGFLNAVIEGYIVRRITLSFSEEELYSYFCENKNVSHNHMYIYSYLLFVGYGTEVSYKESLAYAKKASDYGNNKATRLIGYIYENGKGVEKDLNIAFEYYKRAAASGNSIAYRDIGRFYNCGRVVEKNIEKALEYYKKSEELGNLTAIVDQANLYYNLKEYEKALFLYERASELGIKESYFRLAYMLSNENLVTPDYERAVHYYQLLVDDKSYSAMNNLAVLYSRGQGVEKNLEKAFELYRCACENGGKSIQFSNLASCYFYGRGTETDYQKALEASLKACEFGGDGKAFQILYQCYNEGLGTDKDVERAKYYRSQALDSNDIQIVTEICLDYIKDAREQLNNKLTGAQEVIEKLQEIVQRYSSSEGFFESYLLAEIYYCLYKIEPEKWKEHNGNAMRYAKKMYEEGKELANHKAMQRMYGAGFFDFNIDYDYFAYDEARFNGYTIGTTKVTYVPHIEAKANNYSIEYWLPRARLIYAMYCEIENKNSLNTYYRNAMSTEQSEGQITYKNVIYPNALYMNALRYIMGYDTEIDEDYGLQLLRMAAERYHTRSAYLYGKHCQLQENYEEAIKFYRIAILDKYPEKVERRESIPMVLLKPGEQITYNIFYEYGGQKCPSYEAVEDILECYDKYDRYIQHDEIKAIAELFFSMPYKPKNPDRFFKAFNYYSLSSLYLDKFIEAYSDEFISLEIAVALLNKGKADVAMSIFKKAIKNGDLESVQNAKRVAIDYRIYEGELASAINERLIELGDEKSTRESIAPIECGEKKFDIKNHIAIEYLFFNNANSIISDIASVLTFPNNFSEKVICKVISRYFAPLTPMQIEMSEASNITSNITSNIINYAKTTGQYFKCGVLLLSLNCMEGLSLLSKHYMGNTDSLLKLSEIAIMLYEKQSIVYSFPFSFNKAMCLLSKGKSKGNRILKDLVSLKGASKLEKTYLKPYQPAVDYLSGKEVNEEYLLNIKN